jgi:4-amino-4-deoxy-L-arabinose transferase-like glycosyltransferase
MYWTAGGGFGYPGESRSRRRPFDVWRRHECFRVPRLCWNFGRLPFACFTRQSVLRAIGLFMPTKQSVTPSRLGMFGAAASVYLLFFLGLGRTPLLDPDEPVYGQIAREMVRSGHWLTPHLAGKPWFDKPPLFYWAEAASMTLFGQTELAARLPSAVAAVLLALLVLALGRHWFGSAAGWAGAAVFATSLQTIILGRAAVTDMLFALTLTAPLAAFALWFEAGGRSPGWAAACGASLGLAVLCKGPVAPVLLGGAGLVFLAWERKLHYLLRWDLAVALVCCALVAGPWYAAMLLLHRQAFVDQFIEANNLRRFAQSEHESGSSPFYFVPVLLAFFFPWCLYLGRAVVSSWQRPAGRLLLCWTGVVFLFFSASHTKLVTYIYPLYPAAALLVGAALGTRAGDPRREADLSHPPSASSQPLGANFRVACVTAALTLVFAIGLVLLAVKQYPGARTGAEALALTLVLGTGWGVVASRRSSPLVPYTAMMTGAAVVLAAVILPQVAPAVSLRELAIWEQTTHRPLVGYKLHAPGYLFYTGRELPNESEVSGLEARIQQIPDLAVAMSRRQVPELAAATPQFEWRVIWRRGNRVVVEPTRSTRGSAQLGAARAEVTQPTILSGVPLHMGDRRGLLSRSVWPVTP